jgi:ABC-type iron transport system FetAB ATPase subunit
MSTLSIHLPLSNSPSCEILIKTTTDPQLTTVSVHMLIKAKLTIKGIPKYRTLVQYIPQRPSLLPGTPLDFLTTLHSFSSRSSSASSSSDCPSPLDPVELALEWGVDRRLWMREWGTLSGGEGQRLALAIALGIGGAEVVLLDGESALGQVRVGD